MTTAIFIKSYPKDFEWLRYCLKSINKFATGFSEIVLVIPEGTDYPGTAERVVKVEEKAPGYMWQQVCKMYADQYTTADNISFVDADCVFTEPVTPETFMTDGKPDWLHTPWEKIAATTRAAWGDVMRRCIGQEAPAEFMRRHPQLIPRWALQEFRGFVADRHGVSLEHYIMNQPSGHFSEFNCIGFYLWLCHHDKIHWMNTEDYLPPTVLTQRWSHGGITPEIRAEIEAVLA